MIDYALIFAPDAAATCRHSFAVITNHDFPILPRGRKSVNIAGVTRTPSDSRERQMNHSTAAPDEQQIRIDLAAAFRIIAKLGMHEAVANHFSAAVSADGRKFRSGATFPASRPATSCCSILTTRKA
jgi:hypothetical protein